MNNTLSHADIEARVAELGAQHGRSREARVAFFLLVLEGAEQGLYTVPDDKKAKRDDDAARLYAIYAKASDNADTYDRSSKGVVKGNTSLRRLIEFAATVSGPVDKAQAFLASYRSLASVDGNRPNMKDACNALVDFVREQKDQPEPVPVNRIIFKQPPRGRSQQDVLVAIRNLAQSLYAFDHSVEISNIINSATARIIQLRKVGNRKVASNGVTLPAKYDPVVLDAA